MTDKKTHVEDPDFIDSFFGGAVTRETTVAAPEAATEEKPRTLLDSGRGDVTLGNLLGGTNTGGDEKDKGEKPDKGGTKNLEEDDDDDDKGEDITFAELNKDDTDDDDDPEKNTNPPVGVEELNNAIASLVKEGEIFGYEDEEFKVDTSEKLKELLIANKEEWKRQYLTEELEKDISSLPDEFKYVLDYIKAGGTNTREVLQSILNIENVRNIDPNSEKDSESLTRSYLETTGYGTEDEIEEQILEWKDLDVLDKKANQFKPKLEAAEQKKIQASIKQEKDLDMQRRQLANEYYEGISGALKSRELNGLKLTPKEAVDLENDLIKNNYVSSISNKPINFLGKVLEDISWTKPNYEFLAELTLFAKDREGYRNKVRKEIEQEIVSKSEAKLKLKTVRPLNNGSINTDDQSATIQKKRKTKNFLSL